VEVEIEVVEEEEEEEPKQNKNIRNDHNLQNPYEQKNDENIQ
jgi:hypothetical protein